MSRRPSAFRVRTNPAQVRALIDFGVDTSGYESLVQLQSEGVAAIYNRLCHKRRFAYLADEVGMGKTYEALGVASLVWAQKPDARVVCISPRPNLQTKWERDFKNFFRENYSRRLGVGRSRVSGQPAVNHRLPDNLRDFAVDLRLPGMQAFFLRMTSFRRPVAVFERDTWHESRTKFVEMMKKLGLADDEVYSVIKPGPRSDNSRVLNEAFADALRRLLDSIATEEERPPIDLLIIDEAQALRNPDNQTNRVLRKIFSDDHGAESVVDRWLFLSATPVHGSREDVRNAVKVANSSYTKLDGDLSEAAFRSTLSKFLVRRPRTFRTTDGDASRVLTKVDYRAHHIDDDGWVVRSMDPESALGMALVQKKLVKVLAGQKRRSKAPRRKWPLPQVGSQRSVSSRPNLSMASSRVRSRMKDSMKSGVCRRAKRLRTPSSRSW